VGLLLPPGLQPANYLIVQFDGTCFEGLAIQRGNLTLRPLDSSAVIQGEVMGVSPGTDLAPRSPAQ
jgi:hypothetical protein